MNKTRIFLSFLGVSFILLGFSNCGGSKTNKSMYSLDQEPPFEIIEVYSQDWIAGIKGGGSGTILFVTFSEINKKAKIERIFFRNKIVKAQQDPNLSLLYLGYFKNEINNDIIMDIDPVKEAQNTPPEKFPFNLTENEAVISYFYEGSIHFYKVFNIIEKEVIAYPGTKPKID